MDDMALLREYAARNSEAAFETLVSRRVNFVYSAALRQVRDPHLAEEITQAVFIILAQKAGRISGKTILAGWLFKTTRFAALAQIRADVKRRRREQEAQMQTELQPTAPDLFWEQMSPLLDEALATLGETDRQAVLLRFFENKSLAEVGSSLGTGEDTARKRVSRALEKLHRYFSKRGVSSTTAIIAGTISANSVQAAPVLLAKSVTAVALAKGAAASGSTLTLIKGVLKFMAWTKAKTAIIAGVGVLLAAGTTTLVLNEVSKQPKNEALIDESLWQADSRILEKVPPVLIVRPTRFAGGGGGLDAGDRAIWMNASISTLLSVAYEFPESRLVLPGNLSKKRFDLMLTLANRPRETLQDEIKRKFGLTGHPQTQIANIFLLRMKNPNAPGLKLIRAGDAVMSSSDLKLTADHFRDLHTHNRLMIIPDTSISNFIIDLEFKLKQQIRDETGLTNHFEAQLQWQAQDGETENDAFKRAVLDQLGLELVPSREPIEMLVVEKVK